MTSINGKSDGMIHPYVRLPWGPCAIPTPYSTTVSILCTYLCLVRCAHFSCSHWMVDYGMKWTANDPMKRHSDTNFYFAPKNCHNKHRAFVDSRGFSAYCSCRPKHVICERKIHIIHIRWPLHPFTYIHIPLCV